MSFASEQRQAFSAALLEVGADAPTLCEGWTAHDLAAHCWVRERQPKSLLGIASDRFSSLAEQEMDRAKEKLGYVEMATRLAETPRTPVTLLTATDDLVNGAEFLIHTEDVRRANGLPLRDLGRPVEDLLWGRLPVMGRLFFGKSPVGVILQRSDAEGSVRVKGGHPGTVTLVGRPSELLLFAFGREEHADVRLVGTDEDVAALLAADRGA